MASPPSGCSRPATGNPLPRDAIDTGATSHHIPRPWRLPPSSRTSRSSRNVTPVLYVAWMVGAHGYRHDRQNARVGVRRLALHEPSVCMAVYLAADAPLPLIPWDGARPAFHVHELTEHEAAVRAQLRYSRLRGADDACLRSVV